MSNTANDFLLLFGPFIVLYIGFLAWVVRKLAAHDTALALLIQQVNPPGDKSLRELLHDIQLEQARSSPTNTTQVGRIE